jgi:hypothetical protein
VCSIRRLVVAALGCSPVGGSSVGVPLQQLADFFPFDPVVSFELAMSL